MPRAARQESNGVVNTSNTEFTTDNQPELQLLHLVITTMDLPAGWSKAIYKDPKSGKNKVYYYTKEGLTSRIPPPPSNTAFPHLPRGKTIKKQIGSRVHKTQPNANQPNLAMAPNNQPNIDSPRDTLTVRTAPSVRHGVAHRRGHPRADDYKKSLVRLNQTACT